MKPKGKQRKCAQLPEDNGTVSGLDETQINAEDLARLREACQLVRLLPAEVVGDAPDTAPLDLGLVDLTFHSVELVVSEPVSQRIRVAPLPRRSRIHRAVLPVGMVRVRRGLRLALRQPIRRCKLRLGELSAAQEKELYRQLFSKYGGQAQEMTVQAVFAHIPPEAAKNARISDDLSNLYFRFPANVTPRGAKGGHYLVVVSDERHRTRSVLFRL